MRMTSTVAGQADVTGAAESISKHVATEVRAEMARQRISQDALAKRLGWSQARVSRRVCGEAPIDLDELEQICGVLGVPAAQFMPTQRQPTT